MPRSITRSEAANLEPVHRLHSYCARFPSEIAEAAITEYSKPGDSIYDPFCGSGTSLAAGILLNRRVIGTDVDVLAGMLSSIKCAPASAESYDRWRSRFDKRIQRAFDAVEQHWPPRAPPEPGEILEVGPIKLRLPGFPELNYWFPPRLIALLAAIAEEAHRSSSDHMEQVALVSLSASIIAKWPNTLSYAKDIDHTRPHRAIQSFSVERVLSRYISRLDRTIDSLVRLRTLYKEAGVLRNLRHRSKVICPHDARSESSEIEDASQSLVITSPPYFDAVDYPRAHRLSVCWMNGRAPEDVASRKNYIGIRYAGKTGGEEWFADRSELCRYVPRTVRSNGRLAKLAGFFGDLDASLGQMWRVLRPGGHAVIVIADNIVKGKRVSSHAALANMARQVGFLEISRKPRQIDSVKRRFPVGQFGFDGPMTHEHVVVLQRPKARQRSNASRRTSRAAANR
jgi:DNA modification methylase